MFCALLTSRYQVSVYRTNGPLVLFSKDHRINRSIEWGLLPGNSDQPSLPLIRLAILHSN